MEERPHRLASASKCYQAFCVQLVRKTSIPLSHLQVAATGVQFAWLNVSINVSSGVVAASKIKLLGRFSLQYPEEQQLCYVLHRVYFCMHVRMHVCFSYVYSTRIQCVYAVVHSYLCICLLRGVACSLGVIAYICCTCVVYLVLILLLESADLRQDLDRGHKPST